jgi:hypothetical protein
MEYWTSSQLRTQTSEEVNRILADSDGRCNNKMTGYDNV